MSVGKTCKHFDSDHLRDQEVWLCRTCGEVLKYDPSDAPDDAGYYDDWYYDEPEYREPPNPFIEDLRDL